ncbi:MAG: hypothetical protein OQK52_09640, partial [Ignavibacteriaceae bacterium]|nr:hypothetical protein [Ignavibacteriaceae bacterium]
MAKTSKNIVNVQLQLFFLSAFLIFIFRLLLGTSDTLLSKILFDSLIACSIFFLLLALIKFENTRSSSPLSLVMNVGILSAIMFFIIKFSDFLLPYLFDNINLKLQNPGLGYNIVSLFYILLFIGFISYYLLTLRHLFYLNQGKNVKIYFNTMLVFFVLAALSNNFFQDKSVSFLGNTFFIVAVLLMIFNSI